MPGTHTSRHILRQWIRPFPSSVWNTIKALGLARPTKGKRGERNASNRHQIRQYNRLFATICFNLTQPANSLKRIEACSAQRGEQ